ncbi:unnamed protein product [Spodoptera exigua]|nr:unnamed protein product [Spodoptera exigua]
MSSSSDSDSSFLVSFSSFFSSAAAAAGAAPPAAAGAAPPAGMDDSFSRPCSISSSTLLPLSSAITFLSFSPSASIPTELRIFSTSAAAGDALPPSTASKYAAT